MGIRILKYFKNIKLRRAQRGKFKGKAIKTTRK